jgi:Methyltransferase small domain
MKSLLKRLVSRVVENDYFWGVLNATILRAASYAELKRRSAKEHSIIDPAIQSLFPELKVAHGPFQGMKYPEAQSANSTLFPKLIGSYESELQPILEKICNTNYTEIVDIGCAEGYYAVGLAMRIPSAKVFAFDIDQSAKALCERMAELNHVRQRIMMGNYCDVDTLRSIPFSGRGLIVSDCEGYEKSLFTTEIIPFLAHHDLLIEIHDLVDIEISSLIRERFNNTHVITAIQSVDDIKKTHTYNYEELCGYDLAARKILLAEDRAVIQEWFYMTPRTD